jgi:hypothetical protein
MLSENTLCNSMIVCFKNISAGGLVFDSIDVEEASWLVRSFEVLLVVKGMNSDKALGRDGFSISFSKLVGM